MSPLIIKNTNQERTIAVDFDAYQKEANLCISGSPSPNLKWLFRGYFPQTILYWVQKICLVLK